MGKRCAIPGCSSGDPSEVKRRKALELKQVGIFGIPKSEAEAWTAAMNLETPLTEKQFVCQYHFEDEDLITHFVHTMPNGTVASLERDKYMLRKGAVPVIKTICERPQSVENPEPCSSVVTSQPTPDASPAKADADVSPVKAEDNGSVSQTVEYDWTLQNLDECSDAKELDSSEHSDEGMTNDSVVYTIDKMRADLGSSEWKQCWAWSSNVNEIVFVHLTSIPLQPRLYCSVKNDLTVTVTLADRKGQIELDAVRSFEDLKTILESLETTRECVGTGQAEEMRSSTCSMFLEDDETYLRNLRYQRCFDCRDLREKIMKKTNRTKPTVAAKRSKKTTIGLRQNRHETLQQRNS